MGVAAIAPPIGFSHIRNDRFGMLVLSLQGGDECVLSFDREHFGARLKSKPDSVFSRHGRLRFVMALLSAEAFCLGVRAGTALVVGTAAFDSLWLPGSGIHKVLFGLCAAIAEDAIDDTASIPQEPFSRCRR